MRLSLPLLSSLVVFAAVCAPLSAKADTITYNDVTGFSSSNGTPSVWSYGYGTTTSFTPFSAYGTNYLGVAGDSYWAESTGYNALPFVGINPSGDAFSTATVPADQLWMHPGDGSTANPDSIVLFTAPTAGLYTFSGLFQRDDNGGGTGVHVFACVVGDPACLSEELGTAYQDTELINGTIALTAGESVEFGVAPIGSNGNDSTGLALTVTTPATPEPSSMVLLGTGLLSIAALGRRKFLQA